MKLKGLKVVDLSLFLPGPHLTMMLADHGATVIKIEPPSGEPVRQVGLRQGDHSVWFRNTHRGKRSVVLNLKNPADREVLLHLCDEADVFVEAFRPGVIDRLGIGADLLRLRNPRLVVCSIAAFGQSGPLKDKPAHDLAIQALSGAVSVNLGQDGQPCNPNMPSADMAASLMALSAILMALYRREQSGLGDAIDLSMQDALMAWMPNVVGPIFADDRPPVPQHERSWGGNALYRLYATADGKHVALGGSEHKFVESLARALGVTQLASLAEQGPGPHQQPLVDAIASAFAARSLAQVATLLEPLDLCWAPVLNLHEAWSQPQIAARGMRVRDASGADHIGIPIRFADEPAEPDFSVPTLDQHGSAVRAAVAARRSAFAAVR
jgi:crotonobetainyl-CoA:carnitine CoA-transferase CaiB-like acyl-CoA transferase